MKDINELIRAQTEARLSVLQRHLDNGVIFSDPASTFVDESVVIGAGARIGANCHLRGATVIGAGAQIGENNLITDSEIGEGATVLCSVLVSARVGKHTQVGPFAYLRPGAEAGENCRIGDFVELKNAKLGDGTKVSHLTYVGDAELGRDCNVGCGVVFANYDGEKKARSVVGDECFLGSNCNLVAPVRVGDRSYIAAGTTLTKDVEPDSFMIGRVRQEKLDLRGRYRNRTEEKK